jgi:hypothetical protein
MMDLMAAVKASLGGPSPKPANDAKASRKKNAA